VAEPTILRIVPILPVSDLARAMDFYRSLGFSAADYDGRGNYAFLSRDALRMHLRAAPDLVAGHNTSGVYFYLADRAAGVSILSPLAPREWHMNEFILSDPDGNLLRFGEDILIP
jgi:catechol 2,3-dioxygenase-like lactoylglutathione lyase family enzyme